MPVSIIDSGFHENRPGLHPTLDLFLHAGRLPDNHPTTCTPQLPNITTTGLVDTMTYSGIKTTKSPQERTAHQLPSRGTNMRSRFSSIFATSATNRPIYDQPLLEYQDWLIVPTLGAIVPNWLLLIPKCATLNLLHWQLSTDQTIQDILATITRQLDLDPAHLIWFEHGPALYDSSVGCGIDHAHLHILFDVDFSFEHFTHHITSSSNFFWTQTNKDDPYKSLSTSYPYLIAGCKDESIYCSHHLRIPTQYFRRVIATLSDNPSEWDYRVYPHLNNIVKTINEVHIRAAMS